MNRSDIIKVSVAVALLGFAGYLTYRALGRGGTDRAFFYDLSEKQLFVGPRDGIPPIQGVNDDELDAVRAVVISTNGDATDRAARRIAYLERYSSELKRQMEEARSAGSSPRMGRGASQAHRFVRRVDEEEWHPMLSSEAEAIVSEWLTAGPAGGRAVIVVP